jgi:hypothetical protein
MRSGEGCCTPLAAEAGRAAGALGKLGAAAGIDSGEAHAGAGAAAVDADEVFDQ